MAGENMKKASGFIAAALGACLFVAGTGVRAETLSTVSSTEGGCYALNVAKTFAGVNLAYVKSASATFLTSFGAYGNTTYTLDQVRDVSDGVAGLYYWENDGSTLTFQIQQKDHGYLRGLLIQLVQSGTDVKASVIGHYYPAYDDYGVDFRLKSQGGVFYDCEFDESNGDVCPMALPDLQLIVSDEAQISIDDQWDGEGSGVAAGDTLTWNGGAEGTWTAGDANWLAEDGTAVRWVKGCVARFASDAVVTLPSFRNVQGLLVETSALTFKGDEIRFASPAKIEYRENARVRFENVIAGDDGLVQNIREAHDEVIALDSDAYLSASEKTKILPVTVDLSTMDNLSCKVDTFWGSAQPARTLGVAASSSSEGFHGWNYGAGAQTLTTTLKVVVTTSYGTIVDAVKIVLTQEADGIYAQVVYAKDALGTYDLNKYGATGETSVWDIDFDSGAYRSDCKVAGQDDTLANYHLRIYGFSTTLVDAVPTDVVSEIAGDCKVKGTLSIEKGVVRTVDEGLIGGGMATAEIALSGDAVLELAATSAQTMNGKITVAQPGRGHVVTKPGSNVSFTSNTGSSWELRVAGDTSVSGYNTLPQETGEYGAKKGQTHVLDGGVLRLGAAYLYWGPQVKSDEGLYVENGGTVVLESHQSLGTWMGVCVDGGTVSNASSNADSLLYKMTLNDGALLEGGTMRTGFIDYYNMWSYIAAGGTAPSTVALDEIQIGYQYPAADGKYVGIDFKVADVTQDDATDLLVASPITERPGVTLFAAGYRENLGVWKQGAGTLELSASGTSCATGVFKIEAGAVRFPATASGAFGALVVLGDSEFEVASGASVSFDASSDMAWTEGATLVFSGTMGSRSVRIGTDASALTAAQLSAVKYRTASGRLRAMALDEAGYLRPPSSGLVVTLR